SCLPATRAPSPTRPAPSSRRPRRCGATGRTESTSSARGFCPSSTPTGSSRSTGRPAMRDGAGEGAPIRVFAYVFFPAGGIGRYTSEWATAMNGQPGVEVTLLCGSDFAWKASDAYSVWDGLRPLSHPIPPIRRARFLRGQFVNPLRAVRYAAREGAGVLHFATVNHLSSPLWQRALERAEMKVTATVHDVQRHKAILHR